MTTMDYYAAQDTIRECVCSACWGELDYTQPDKTNARLAEVHCQHCKDHTPGFVSRKWAERTAENNQQQFEEARRALRDALPWMKREGGAVPVHDEI